MTAKWILVGFFAFATLLTIGSIGKPRKALTPGNAVAVVVVNAVIIATIVIWWQS